MPFNEDCNCKDIIILKEKVDVLNNIVNELKQDIVKQDIILSNKDSIMGEIHSDNKKILDELKEMKENIKAFDYIKTDYPNTKVVIERHLTDHKDKDKQTSNRNWGLWMVLITTVISSIIGLIVNLLK
jgi:hypothetical protein